MVEVALDSIDYGYEDRSHARENRIQVQLSNLRPAYPRRDPVERPRHQLSVVPESNHHPNAFER